jgi:hypothetical protein
MRLQLYTVILLLCIAVTANGQDVIHFTDGTNQTVIVKKIGPKTISYKKVDNPTGPEYTVKVNSVDHISYANGTEATLEQLHPNGIHSKYNKAYYRRIRQLPITEPFQIKITPSSLLDPWGATLPISLQYNLGNRYAIEATVAIPLKFIIATPLGDSLNVTRIKQDEKFALSLLHYVSSRKNMRGYGGIEVTYRRQLVALGAGKLDAGHASSREENYLLFSSADLLKNYFTASFKVGLAQRIAGNFWVEAFGGVGFIGGNSYHNNVQVSGSTTEERATFLKLPENTNVNLDNGWVFGIYMPFAIRFVYTIGTSNK